MIGIFDLILDFSKEKHPQLFFHLICHNWNLNHKMHLLHFLVALLYWKAKSMFENLVAHLSLSVRYAFSQKSWTLQQLKKIVEKLEKETKSTNDDDDDDNEGDDDDDNDGNSDGEGDGEPKFIWRKAGSARRVIEPTLCFFSKRFITFCKEM